ncbi:MAG TPA: hypothetical protein VMD91_10610 [Candidatus Sulfotelmatobacter sp.]|nr:hypothetical protein [Candidatus Sulfotelmatobacter sp.]
MRAWAKAVDARLIEIAPGLEFHLEGKSVFEVLSGSGVPEEAFDQPCWLNQGAFVSIWPPSDVQDQARAVFVSPVVPGFPTKPWEERYYHRTRPAALKAADDIARFLLAE